jgi:multidrug transporter EmrE-like cation transporter
MPSAVAVSVKSAVFAARQGLSDPVWMNPTTMSLYVSTLAVGVGTAVGVGDGVVVGAAVGVGLLDQQADTIAVTAAIMATRSH